MVLYYQFWFATIEHNSLLSNKHFTHTHCLNTAILFRIVLRILV